MPPSSKTPFSRRHQRSVPGGRPNRKPAKRRTRQETKTHSSVIATTTNDHGSGIQSPLEIQEAGSIATSGVNTSRGTLANRAPLPCWLTFQLDQSWGAPHIVTATPCLVVADSRSSRARRRGCPLRPSSSSFAVVHPIVRLQATTISVLIGPFYRPPCVSANAMRWTRPKRLIETLVSQSTTSRWERREGVWRLPPPGPRCRSRPESPRSTLR